MKKLEHTLDSREAAEMMGKEHKNLMRDINRYIKQINEANTEKFNQLNIAPVEFFKESTYKDAKGETRPCYLVTKKGCEFIAHKLTGQKGTEFTARYINRFHEMEHELITASPSEIPLGELASYLKIIDRIAHRQNLSPHRIAANFKKVSEQFGVELTEDFVKAPEYEQLTIESMGK